MGRPPVLNGKPNDLDYIHIKLPVWLKKKAIERAAERAEDLTAYLRRLLVEDLGDRKTK